MVERSPGDKTPRSNTRLSPALLVLAACGGGGGDNGSAVVISLLPDKDAIVHAIFMGSSPVLFWVDMETFLPYVE